MYKYSYADGFTNDDFVMVLWILLGCHFPHFVCFCCAKSYLLANGRNQPHTIFFFMEYSVVYTY